MGFLRETIRAYQKNDPAARSALEIFFPVQRPACDHLLPHFPLALPSLPFSGPLGVPACQVGHRGGDPPRRHHWPPPVIDHGTGIVVGATAEMETTACCTSA